MNSDPQQGGHPAQELPELCSEVWQPQSLTNALAHLVHFPPASMRLGLTVWETGKLVLHCPVVNSGYVLQEMIGYAHLSFFRSSPTLMFVMLSFPF